MAYGYRHDQVPIMLTLILGLFVGCGKGFETMQEPGEVILPGSYIVELRPIHEESFQYYGWSKILIQGDQIWIRAKVFGDSPGIQHMQHIHAGDKCPSLSSDSNKDGIVDVVEGRSSFGGILIPLDSDLSTQIRGISDFPIMERRGFYYYSESASVMRVMSDLRNQRFDSLDNIMIHLESFEGLDLDRRTMVVFGVHGDINLPPTVADLGGHSASSSVPIACGHIQKVKE